MIYIDDENIEILMLKKYMEDRSDTNEKEIETMKRDLRKAMGRLSKNQRKVLEMYFYEDKKENEIAIDLNKHQQSINKTKNNALKRLKTILVEQRRVV